MKIEKDQNFVILETKESWKENQNQKQTGINKCCKFQSQVKVASNHRK